MHKKVAILQSNYIPWKGYFDLIAAVDEFILYDDMQYTKNDWRNRNKVKTNQGIGWLTVPVGKCISRRIRDVEIPSGKWQSKHWKTIVQNYRSAAHFGEVSNIFEPLYIQRQYTHLSIVNRTLIEAICGYLGITTKISNSWDYKLISGKTERLADLCLQVGATKYISGPAAKGYINENIFDEYGVKLIWFDYDGYPKYPQLWGNFTHQVSILDLMFNCGQESPRYMRYVNS